MKVLFVIPFLFCLQDTVKVDTTRVDTAKFKKQIMFFEEPNIEHKTANINIKLDSLIAILQARNDSTKFKY